MKSSKPKIGITVSKKFGNACKRNHFKRCAREAFRQNITTIPSSLVIQVCPLPRKAEISPGSIGKDLETLIEKIKHTS